MGIPRSERKKIMALTGEETSARPIQKFKARDQQTGKIYEVQQPSKPGKENSNLNSELDVNVRDRDEGVRGHGCEQIKVFRSEEYKKRLAELIANGPPKSSDGPWYTRDPKDSIVDLLTTV
ncbi:hypothetical protein MKW92_005979 [Papaver armeniacum]|nr:hypothetical protein MKW92_005979 [Papaver armeniacum]